MQPSRQQHIAQLAEGVATLFEELQARGIRDQKDLWFLHSKAPKDEADPAAQQYAKILAGIKQLNPANLSDRLVTSQIVYGAIAIALWYRREADNILLDAQVRIDKLASYGASRTVDIPIENLDVGGSPYEIGPVTFLPFTHEDKASRWWESITAYVPHHADFHVVSYARVKAIGDPDTAVGSAIKSTEKILVILRAIGFPFSNVPLPQLGILTDHPLSPGRPLRLGDPTETVRIEGHLDNMTLLGPPTAPYRIQEDLLHRLTPTTLSRLRDFLSANFEESGSGLKSKFINGLLWLGRATFPDTPEASVAKIAFSLESMIGGDPNEEYLSSKGLTAALCERAAFIAGTDLSTRTNVHKAVADLYRLRGDIVHGRTTNILTQDLPTYGELVRSIAWSLLPRLDEIASIDELQKWVHDSRYSSP